MRAHIRSLALAFCIALSLPAAFACVARSAPLLPLGHAGRWITDASGRVVIVHGINMVYKIPPYHPAAAGFGDDDAAFLERIGFNAVRVGVIWKAVEPRPGAYDDAYLHEIARTVATLARHGIVSLLDFHQDMYNERFQGEGAPDWAVRDDGLPSFPQFGFPGNYELMPALQHAYDHFWSDSAGPGGVGLEDRYAAAWRHVAQRFRRDRSVLGYELFNEPFPGTPYAACAASTGCPAFDAKLTAFNREVAAAIGTVDRRTLVFYEPNVLFDFGFATSVGALERPRGGFAFHDYCFTEPSNGNGCSSEGRAFANALRHVARTREALLLTEFGSTTAAGDLTGMVKRADAEMVPWLEWAYCPCHDPTGAPPDPLVQDPSKPPSGSNLGSLGLRTLVEPYPQVIAGTPRSWGFDATTRTLRLRYTTARVSGHSRFGAGSITEIATPGLVYAGHYGVRVVGAAILSVRGASVLRVAACPRAGTISVTVTPSGARRGSCRPAPRSSSTTSGPTCSLWSVRRCRRRGSLRSSRSWTTALAQHRAEDPVDERGRVGAAEPLRGLDGLVDRALRGDRVLPWKLVGIQHLGQPDAQDRALERGDPPERPPRRVLGDQLVKLRLAVAHELCKRPRERMRAARDGLVERPVEEVALVKRPYRGPPLLRPTHGLSPARERHARDTYSPERVSTRTTSPMLTNSGTWILAPVSSTAGFVPPPDAVSPRTPGSVSATARSIALGSCTSAGFSSMYSTSTSSDSFIQRNASPTAPTGIVSCS